MYLKGVRMTLNSDNQLDWLAYINVIMFPMQDLVHTLIDNHVHQHRRDKCGNHLRLRSNHQLVKKKFNYCQNINELICFRLRTNTTKSD